MNIIFSLLANPVVLAQAKSSGSSQKVSGFGTWGIYIVIAVMLLVFYFLIIVPQRKRARAQEDLLSKVEPGDEVVTIGGVHGTVKKVADDTVVIEVDKGVKLTFSRSAIARNLTVHEEPEEEEEEEEEEVEEGVPEEEAGAVEETEPPEGEPDK